MTRNDENEVVISPGEYVTVTKMGHIVEVQHMKRKNRTCHITKLDADRYMVNETGEICEFEKSSNRAESEASIRKTFKRLRYLVNGNFTGAGNELFITLTYAENMTDTKKLYTDFRDFMKRFRYKLKLKSSELDYLSVVEPQERGAWHMHVLLRFNGKTSVYLPADLLATTWGHGFVQIQRLQGVDNIGAYLTAYLSDVELPEGVSSEGKNVVIREVNGQEKKFVKGARLWRYPPGMRLYRNSKGIVKPERVEMTYKNAKKIVGCAKPHYKKSYELENIDFKNTITYEQYNLKRR